MEKYYDEFDARYMNLLTDFGFHKIFGTESNKDLLIDFLNQIINEEGVITDIKILPPEQWRNFETDRKAVFDIFCKTEKDEYLIVEMQVAKQSHFRDRSLFYASLPIVGQAPKGVWNYELKSVYFVGILDFVLFDEFDEDKDRVLEHACVMRESTKTVYSKKLRFAFVELPKFKKTEKDLETHFDKWLYVLKNMPKLKDRPDSVQGKIFDKLFKLAERNKLKNKDMETYRKSILEYHDVRSAMECARDEALEKGIIQGREEGRNEGRMAEKNNVIQKYFQKNVPIEDIVFFTGYTEDQILRLKKMQ